MKNKKGNWLFYLGLASLLIGVAAVICSIVFKATGHDKWFDIACIVIAVSGPVSIILLIIKLYVYGGAPSPEPKTPKVKTFKYNEKSMPIVDVKEFKKSQDEIMYEKYVDLYNKKIISKEDLDKKRIELLGK